MTLFYWGDYTVPMATKKKIGFTLIAILAFLIIFLIITMPLFSLMAVDSLSDYDITFYKTVSESLSIVNKEKFIL